MKPKVIDLFCGAGGFSEGFRQAGFEIVQGIDLDKVAISSFSENFPDAYLTLQKDILELDSLPNTDVIIGSPPCQDFSVSNPTWKENPELIYYFLYLIARARPKYWVLEEVPAVAKFLPRNVNCSLLQANFFGLGHKRRRVFAGNFPKQLVPYISPITQYTLLASEYKGFINGGRNWYTQFKKETGRIPTTDEAKEVMGFPADYVFCGNKKERWKQIGNAVCPPIAKGIAESILEKLTGVD